MQKNDFFTSSDDISCEGRHFHIDNGLPLKCFLQLIIKIMIFFNSYEIFFFLKNNSVMIS